MVRYLNAGAALSARHTGRMDGARDQGIFDLQVGDGMHGPALRIVAAPTSESPDIADITCLHRFGDGCSDRVLDRHVRIDPCNRRIGDIFWGFGPFYCVQ